MPATARHHLLLPLALLLLGCGDAVAPRMGPLDLTQPWVEASPADLGANAALVDQAIASARNQRRLLSLLAVKDGRLVVDEYFNGNNVDDVNDVRSVTKSVVSTLTGIALEQGLIPDLDVKIVDLVDSAQIPLTNTQRDITVRHLLTMTAGFDWQETGGPSYGEWILSGQHLDFLLGRPMADAPGATFTYNSAAVFLLGLVLEQVSGQSLPDYAEQHLFSPLGIDAVVWEPLADGAFNGGAGLDLRPRDLARFGQLFLQDGMSGGAQNVNADWVREAGMPRFSWNFSIGPVDGVTYGRLWWAVTGELEPAYFAWGFGGQFIYVVPELDLVLVGTTDWRGVTQDGGARPLEEEVLQILVGELLPAFR